MQLKLIFTSTLIVIAAFLTSCKKDLLQPDNDNHSGEERLLTDAAFAEGLLLNAYASLPNGYTLEEVASDDAVTNVDGNSYRRTATGEWSAIFNPFSVWSSAYQPIYYINHFLSINDKVDYAWDDRGSPSDEREAAFRKRFKGEAVALRAWYNFELLKKHGGIGANGNPLGFVIMKEPSKKEGNANIPRSSYTECVQFILNDIETAISLLPDVYANQGTDIVYNAVFGSVNKNRVNGLFAKALKSRVTLYVASMPFNNEQNKWATSATAAAELLRPIGGIAGLSSTGINFWRAENDKEILFRRDFFNANSREQQNFPPSRFGRGETNPSQNLVDAFPMTNGYPISDIQSNYNPDNPYAGRDPRLKAYILYNGNELNNVVVHTNVEDPLNGLNQTVASTRTGYYLKKLLQPAVNLTPTVMSTQRQFYTLFRYTEIFLNYAEAANEAWGPDEDPMGYGFTASQIMGAIRKRAGIAQPDNYLNSVTSQSAMRDLIRNERRIELCFEGFRFWDMRRWDMDLSQPVKGMSIANGVSTVINVENRAYSPFMKYGPIPNIEILKSNALVQNTGW